MTTHTPHNAQHNALNDLTTGFIPRPAHQTSAYTHLYDTHPLSDLAFAQAQRTPEKLAIIDGERHITYRTLCHAADQFAHHLTSTGTTSGDRIILHLPNSAATLTAFLGCLRAGVVPIMAIPAHGQRELTHFITTGTPTQLYTDDSLLNPTDINTLAQTHCLIHHTTVDLCNRLLDEASHNHQPVLTHAKAYAAGQLSAPTPDPGLPALMLVSGGTTGLPKLIARTHQDYRLNVTSASAATKLQPGDVYLAVLPLSHNFPLSSPGALGIFQAGGTVVCTTNPSPESCFRLIETHHVTITSLVPALAQLWTAATAWEKADLSSLRTLQVGGARLAPETARSIDAAFNHSLQQVFGMAEGLLCFTDPEDTDRERVCTTQGAPMCTHDEIRIVDHNDNDVACGTDGELLTRGPYTIAGYYRAAEHNRHAFTAEGYYRTGDRVHRTKDGHMVVSGRFKDVIIRAGENVTCSEVEDVLLSHPGIYDVGLVGLADDLLGERIVAAVIPTQGHTLTLAELRTFVIDAGLAAFKAPDALVIRTNLPTTSVGKLDRKKLRELLAATETDN
ncbi:AMP-binding protein [Corynebacterium felinum]|uniref:Mycobactin salicyl-AMP ligase n=1 Tax=Corynebacterium felinum TaxID=131318 RepID=A0ABU2B9Y7_9CORY|nr:AMP-binding protein [Corynebacterium felinum]MDF5821773.1 AMP-binding protein [Corynebacterium felinum]MDR7355420.1 mycobactin salicyl-AMP ligase [Corynebacterium felinum]WJY94771.1 2,3-dihydroxybenzoate-AMP ligase [Corynebacterium felinum]